MNQLIELLKESVLTQAIISMMVIGGYLACIFLRIEVPSELRDLLIAVVMFYFGSKLGIAQGKYTASKEIER